MNTAPLPCCTSHFPRNPFYQAFAVAPLKVRLSQNKNGTAFAMPFSVICLEYPFRVDKPVFEPRAEIPVHHCILTRGRVDYRTVSHINRHMSAHTDDVAAPQIANALDCRKVRASPASRRHIIDVISCLVQGVIDPVSYTHLHSGLQNPFPVRGIHFASPDIFFSFSCCG